MRVPFKVATDTGLISVAETLDRERKSSYSILVQVTLLELMRHQPCGVTALILLRCSVAVKYKLKENENSHLIAGHFGVCFYVYFPTIAN